jgi:hypothetical protein
LWFYEEKKGNGRWKAIWKNNRFSTKILLNDFQCWFKEMQVFGMDYRFSSPFLKTTIILSDSQFWQDIKVFGPSLLVWMTSLEENLKHILTPTILPILTKPHSKVNVASLCQMPIF